MGKLQVTEALVEKTVGEVAPLVEGMTGWPLALEGLGVRVVPRSLGYEEIVLGRLRGVGIEFDADEARGLVERLVEYLVEGNALGAYEPSTGEVLIVRENVDDSNMDGLRLVVAHELVHRGQHVTHGALHDRVDAAIRSAFRALERGELGTALRAIEAVRPVMSLMESHASYVQESLRASRFPNAVIESHLSLPALLLRLVGRGKTSQYREALPAVVEAAGRGDVDSLYRAL